MRDRRSDKHRSIAAQKLGRALRPDEDVDHLNENKEDNTSGNLEVLNHSEHSKRTQSPERKSLRRLQKSLGMVRRKEKLY